MSVTSRFTIRLRLYEASVLADASTRTEVFVSCLGSNLTALDYLGHYQRTATILLNITFDIAARFGEVSP